MKRTYNSINRHLTERLVQIDQVAECIQQLLNIPDQNRIWPIIQRRNLLLMTDDAVIATQVRFMQKFLCKQLNQQLNINISTIEIKLLSLPLHPPARIIKRSKISRQTLDIMKSIASDITDKDLSIALCRLADAITEPTTQQA